MVDFEFMMSGEVASGDFWLARMRLRAIGPQRKETSGRFSIIMAPSRLAAIKGSAGPMNVRFWTS